MSVGIEMEVFHLLFIFSVSNIQKREKTRKR